MKKIKDLIYKIKESTRLQLIVGAISVGLIVTGVVGVIAYKNSNNSLASSGEVEEANESEADIILTENESGELVATDKEGNVVASGEDVEKLVEEKKSKGETVVAKTEDGTTVKVDKVDGDKVTSSGGQTVKPSPKPPVIADKPTDKPSNGGNSDNGSSNKPTDKPSNGGDSNNNNNNNNNKPSEPSEPSKPEKPTEPSEPVEPEKPSYPAKGFDKSTTDKFNARMLDQGFAQADSYSGMPAYSAIKNYALNKTPIPTNKLINEGWGCKATGKVLTFTDTFKYTDDPAVWSRSLNAGKLAGCNENYQTIFANYAVCNSNGDGTFTVTVYALDMTDL
ncbi:hypothetical protein [Clostridium paraputrificum]|uniref:hypothetical protein n=1 Tax=Clostridium paraputrificum TaxID=29363 RepID=UPI0018A915CD|nr:hypothetical protein [Clostridium paraputrificum]MDB2098800.1 hypothetical protein [Clostridium paraputrificum]